MTKKLITLILCLCFVFSPLTVFAEGEEQDEQNKGEIYNYVIPNDSTVQTLSPNIIMYCKDTDTVMYHKNEKKIIEPGSFVKVMVGAVALELYRDRLDETVTIDPLLIAGAQGLSIQLTSGETVTVKDLLYALMLMGANDAAVVLSRLHTGNSEDFIELMNEKVKSLGAQNTVYKNVTGLHAEGMVTTLNDTVKIIDYAAGVEGFLDITSTDRYVIPENSVKDERTLITRNCLLSKYRDTRYKTSDVTGMNYGSTAEAGECLIATATKGGLTYYIAVNGGFVTRDTEKELTVFKDTLTLLTHAEEDFIYTKVLSKKKSYGQMPVKYNSTSNEAKLVPTDDVVLYMSKRIDTSTEIEYRITTYEKAVAAPVSKGQVVGKMSAYYRGVKLCTVPVSINEDIEQNRILYFLDKIEELTRSTFFIVSAIVFAGLLIVYISITGIVSMGKKRGRKRLK